MDYLLAGHEADIIGIAIIAICDGLRIFIKHYLAHHHAMLTDELGQGTCIDAANGRDILPLQPGGQALYCVPMAILLAVPAYDKSRNMYLAALHESGKAVGLNSKGRDAIITDQRVS